MFVLLRVGETTLRSTRVSANEDDYVHLSMDPLSLTSAPPPTKSVKQTVVETRELDYISMDDILRVCSMCHSSCRRCVRQGMLCSHIRSVFANCYARAHGQSVGPFTRAISRAEQSGEETDECIEALPRFSVRCAEQWLPRRQKEGEIIMPTHPGDLTCETEQKRMREEKGKRCCQKRSVVVNEQKKAN